VSVIGRKDLSLGPAMINVSHLLLRRTGAGSIKVTVVESPDTAQRADLAAAALEQKIQHLADELGRVQRELRAMRAGVHEPEIGDSSTAFPTQSNLAYKILVGFCVRNASELSESKILEMISGDRMTVEAVLSEMCDQGLMAVTGTDNPERTYAVTSLGQRQVFAFRTLGVGQSGCAASDASSL
jgi:hypothetical protein